MKKQSKIKSLNGSYKILINKTMLSYCLKCRKKWEIKARELQRQTKENQCFYQNVPCFIKSLELEFTYSACWPFTKNKERIQKFKETGDSKYIHQNELDKTYFQHDMACEDFKELPKRTTSDKVLRNKAFNITSSFY